MLPYTPPRLSLGASITNSISVSSFAIELIPSVRITIKWTTGSGLRNSRTNPIGCSIAAGDLLLMDRIPRAVDGTFSRKTPRAETFDLGGKLKRIYLSGDARTVATLADA